MIVALDVHYDETLDAGRACGVIFDVWGAEAATRTIGYRQQGIAAYVPGRFVLRELPCILPPVEAAMETWSVQTLVVDGFVDLGPGRPGLGRHLFERLSRTVEVVGVSKSPFAGAPGLAVTRGTSVRPLWVTSTGDSRLAAENLVRMAGEHRIPRLLKLADTISRGNALPDLEL